MPWVIHTTQFAWSWPKCHGCDLLTNYHAYGYWINFVVSPMSVSIEIFPYLQLRWDSYPKLIVGNKLDSLSASHLHDEHPSKEIDEKCDEEKKEKYSPASHLKILSGLILLNWLNKRDFVQIFCFQVDVMTKSVLLHDIDSNFPPHLWHHHSSSSYSWLLVDTAQAFIVLATENRFLTPLVGSVVYWHCVGGWAE